MVAAMIQGLMLGLLLSVFIGPVFFLLIETSIKSGVKAAFVMDAGVVLSDMLWITLLYFGVGKYISAFLYNPGSRIIAGVIFILFGLSGLYALKKVKKSGVADSKGKLFRKGFLLNSVNPSVALFWLATITFAIRRFKGDDLLVAVFFGTVFITVLSIDTFKFFMAKKLRPFLNEKRQQILSISVSTILIFFGIYMIFEKSM